MGGGLVVVGILYAKIAKELPTIVRPEDYRPWLTTEVFSEEGKLIAEFFEEKRYVVSIDKIPSLLQKAFVAAEDGDFYQHQGVSVLGIIRAALANFRAGRVVQGGSTITQQVAKSLLLSNKRTFLRKLQDLILAIQMERNLSKDQIMFLYLNQIYLGHGAYGVEAASRTYFKKHASELNISEMAVLAGLPQAPSRYSPISNPQMAKARQVYVLRRMYEEGAITQKEAVEAVQEQVKVYLGKSLNKELAPHFSEHVRRILIKQFGANRLYRDGLKVKTTVHLSDQLLAQEKIQSGLRDIDKRQGFRGAIKNLKSADEIKAFVLNQFQEIQDEVYDYRIIVGLDLKDLGVRSEKNEHGKTEEELSSSVKTEMEKAKNPLDIVPTNKLILSVVTAIDSENISLEIAGVAATVTKDYWKWAKPQLDGRGGEIVKAIDSKLLPGDVVWARIVDKNFEDKKNRKRFVLAALEQVPEVQGALLSMESPSGAVISMVGGYDFNNSEFNRALQAIRQPGSVFKPIIYSAGIDRGFTPASTLVDSPIVFDNPTDNPQNVSKWKPDNYGETFTGDTTMAEALMHSRNVPTIKLLQEVSIPYVLAYAKLLGIRTPLANDLTLALGSSGTTLWDIVKAYGVFANQGKRIRPYFIEDVTDYQGTKIFGRDDQIQEQIEEEKKVLAEMVDTLVDEAIATKKTSSGLELLLPKFPAFGGDPEQVLEPTTVSVLTSMLKNVVLRGTGTSVAALGRPVAGKTGTTNGTVDALFVGFTPQVVTGVWTGFDTERSIGPGETGAKAAAPIWLEFMKSAVGKYDAIDFPEVSGTRQIYFDSKSGGLARTPTSPGAIPAFFKEGTEPTSEVAPKKAVEVFRDEE